MRQVIAGIEMSSMLTSMSTIVNERLKAGVSGPKKHSYSIYRDLLFLSFVALGRENIDQGEYIDAMMSTKLCSSLSSHSGI